MYDEYKSDILVEELYVYTRDHFGIRSLDILLMPHACIFHPMSSFILPCGHLLTYILLRSMFVWLDLFAVVAQFWPCQPNCRKATRLIAPRLVRYDFFANSHAYGTPVLLSGNLEVHTFRLWFSLMLIKLTLDFIHHLASVDSRFNGLGFARFQRLILSSFAWPNLHVLNNQSKSSSNSSNSNLCEQPSAGKKIRQRFSMPCARNNISNNNNCPFIHLN